MIRPQLRSKTAIVVTTVPGSLFFFQGQIRALRNENWQVIVASSPGPRLIEFAEGEGAEPVGISIARTPAPMRDLLALARLTWLFVSRRPTIVHAHTPKAALLSMIAAWVARVPRAFYTMHGLPLLTRRGWMRELLATFERLTCRLADRVFCVSASLRAEAIALGLCAPERIAVIGPGSANGVDTQRFHPPDATLRAGARRRLGIPEKSIVVGYVGRIVREKGVGELARAWETIKQESPDVVLLITGAVEVQDAVPGDILDALRADPRVCWTGYRKDPRDVYAAMDVFCLPSYREGFPVVTLEAAAMALPIVATDIPGTKDAVVNGTTGILVPVRDPEALAIALLTYLADPARRTRDGSAARNRVMAEFKPGLFAAALTRLYSDSFALRESRRAAPAVAASGIDR